MKKTILVVLALLTLNMNAQEMDTLTKNEVYSNYENNLFVDTVLSFDSTNKSILLNSFENWASSNFRDYEKVRVAKTDNFISLLYIQDKQYVKLDARFKDNKIKVEIYDDGNVFVLGDKYTASKPSRSFYLKDYFSIQGDGQSIIYKNKNGFFNTKYKAVNILIDYKIKFLATIADIYASILKENDKKLKIGTKKLDI